MTFPRANSIRLIWLLFIVSPFLTLVLCLKNFRSSWFRNLVWIFTIFYGFTFVVYGDDSDAIRYRDALTGMHQAQLSFKGIVELFYSDKTDNSFVDILQPTITFLVSLFTDNLHVLFSVFGLVFGFFYSRNIAYVLDFVKGKIKPVVLLLFIVFAFIHPIWDINGFRMWTAAHMFLYGVMPFLAERKKNRLWATALSIFMHFSFFFPLLILAIFMLAGTRRHIYFAFFIATFFIAQLDLSVVRTNLSEVAPELFQERVKVYTSEEYADDLVDEKAKVNWYILWYGRTLSWTVTLLLVMIYYRGRRFLLQHRQFNALFSFTLFFYGWANLAALMPSGGRFVSIVQMLAILCIIIYLHYSEREKWAQRIVYFVSPFLFLYLIVSIRIGFDSMSAATVFGNPLISFFTDENTALIDLIK